MKETSNDKIFPKPNTDSPAPGEVTKTEPKEIVKPSTDRSIQKKDK